jgi:hypothetical protein
MYQGLKGKWDSADVAVKVGVAAVAAVVAAVFALKILPFLIAGLGIGAFLAILFVPYWAPTIIAFARKHPSRGAVLALNFFLGWTFVGWIVSLVWALSDNTGRAPQSVIIQNTVNATAGAVTPPPPPMQYQIGDVVNGHRFDGAVWTPVPPSSAPASPSFSPGALPAADG